MEFVENRVFEAAPGVFVRNAVDNCAWVDLGSGVAVIDALEDPDMGPVIQDDIAATVGKPMRWLINTHWHPDHIACNPAWHRAGATIIAHESCARSAGQSEGKPDVTFSDTYTLEGEGRRADMKWVGGTHTQWDTVVYFPWARTLHIADLFGWGLIPVQQVDDPMVARIHEVLSEVLRYDADVLIPGHGPLLTPAHIRRWLTYFDDLLDRVPPLARQSQSMEQLEAAVPIPDDMRDWWRLPDWKHKRNLEIVAASRA